MSVFAASSFGKGYCLQYVGCNHRMILGILAVVHSTENLWPLHVFGPKTCPISKWDNIMQYFKTVLVRKIQNCQELMFFRKKITMEITHLPYVYTAECISRGEIIWFQSHAYLTHEFASRTTGLLEFPILDPRTTSSFLMLTVVIKES